MIRVVTATGMAALACGSMVPTHLAGQTVVTGLVTGKGRPLVAVEITASPGEARSVTDESGRYRLLIAPSGLVRILARAVGYYPAARRLALAGGDTVRVDFVLDPTAQQLDSLTVEAPAASLRGKMSAFEERRAVGFGRFFTRAMLAEREHSTLADVLRMTPGVQFVRRPAVCGGGYSAATGRGGVVQWRNWMSCGMGFPMQAACYFAIYLDGARYWVPGANEPPDINQFTVQGIEAMEVYRGPAEMPIQYQTSGSSCGLVLLWTRER